MQTNSDFKDLFAALNAAEAEYLVVGALALAAHGHVRATKDLDVWVRPTPENAERVHSALASFGAPLQDLTVDDLASADWDDDPSDTIVINIHEFGWREPDENRGHAG